MIALALTLAAVPAPLALALSRQAPPGARIEVTRWESPTCAATTFEPATLDASGRVAVRAVGRGCAVWGWATVRVTATVAIVDRPLSAGDPLEGAVRFEEREWSRTASSAPAITGAVASRRLSPGTVVRSSDLRLGPPPGTSVTVRVVSSGIAIEQRGAIFACPERVCATLPSGKRISGTFTNGVLLATVEGTR
jgi:hypothetical protein